MKELWNNIRYHTEAKGKTLTELGEYMGITADALRRKILRGAKVKDVAKIAAWLGVDACELAFGSSAAYTEDRRNAETLRRLAEASMEYAATYFEELRSRHKLTPLVVEAAAQLGLI